MGNKNKSVPITIVIPVGPNPAYLDYLPECVESIAAQTNDEDEILFVDDMSGLPYCFWETDDRYDFPLQHTGWWSHIKNDWLLGCAASWNIGTANAKSEWCILMGSDDRLLPGALEACREVISDPKHDPLGYYNLTCITSEDEVVTLHNNAALVSRALWKATGGFPVSASLGAPDAMLISIMMIHMPQQLLHIQEGVPLYWVRVHEHQDTKRMAGPFNWEVIQVRNIETERWVAPEWTKHVP